MVKLNWRAKRGFAACTTDPSNFSFSWKVIISDGLFLLGFLAFRCRSLCVVRDCHCVWLCKGGHSAAWLCFHALPLRNAVLRGFALCCVTLQLQAVFSHCLCSLFSYRGVNCLPGCPVVQGVLPLLPPPLHQGCSGGSVSSLHVFVWLKPEWVIQRGCTEAGVLTPLFLWQTFLSSLMGGCCSTAGLCHGGLQWAPGLAGRWSEKGGSGKALIIRNVYWVA